MAPAITIICVTALAAYLMAIFCAPDYCEQVYLVVPLTASTAERAIEDAVRCAPGANVIALDMGDADAAEIAQLLSRRYPWLKVATCEELSEVIGCQR
jgi:electron transfer flavoprotein alpha/beta subunit